MADFNPGFSFDLGGSCAEAPAQAPWEFGGALKMAIKGSGPPGASSVDAKIAQRLQDRSKRQAAKQAAAKGKRQQQQQQQSPAGRKRQRPGSDAEDASGSESPGEGGDAEAGSASSSEPPSGSGSEDTSDSDQPLPGELDSDEGDEDMQDADSAGEDESGSEEPGSDDELRQQQQQQQPAAGRGKQQQQQHPKASAAAAAAARRAAAAAAQAQAANGAAGSGGSSSEDGEQPSGSGSEDESGSERSDDAPAQQPRQQRGKGKQQPASKQQQGGKAGFFAETQRGFKASDKSFQDLNLSRPLLRAVAALGYAHPTPIQAACIPLALAGRDVCGSAMTGSGKTAAFALPILERLLYRPRQVAATYVLILAPTRELAAQIHSMVQRLAQFTDVDAALIVGGLSLQAQAAALRAGPAIVVGTPGRLIDHVRNSQGFGLEDLSVLVLDEADRLLEMGFKEELRELLRLAPRSRQTMLFSATFNDDVAALVSLSLRQPVRLAADPAAAAPKQLSQEIVRLKGAAGGTREAALLALAARSFSGGRTIVFCKTKQRAHRLKILFGLCSLPPAAELHGDMTQAARLESLEAFRQGRAGFLLATDVAARGLDILGVQVVLNFDAPRSLETYLHRIGRTARAGAGGVAVSLIGDEDRALLKEVVKKGCVDLKQRLVPQQAIAKWQARIEAAEPDVCRVLQEEREEAAIRRAEMEANKAANLLEHESEIFSRPARTWFQSEREKKALAQAAAAAAEGRTVLEDAAGRGGEAGRDAKARAKAAAKQDKRNAKLKERRAAEAASGKSARPELQAETEAFSKAIKGVKSRVRSLMQEQGLSAKAAQKIAQKAVTGVSSKPGKKKQKTGDKAGASGGGLFSGDGLAAPGEGGGGGGGVKGSGGAMGGGGAPKHARAASLSRTDLNRLKRGGKGKAGFKSKARFKRKRK